MQSQQRKNQEARRLLGFKRARYDIVCSLDSDNYIEDRDWLRKLYLPFDVEADIVGSFTLHYKYDKEQSLFNRYVGLFGVLDSVVPYLKKNDRQKITEKSWPYKEQIVKINKKYTVLSFNDANFPTLGCNGFMVRKKFIKPTLYKPEEFFHTDFLYDLLYDGKTKYAVINTTVTHDTAASVGKLMRKRIDYMSLHHLVLFKKRRYKVFDPSSKQDIVNIIKFAFFTITLIEPLSQSVKGYMKVKDVAWFFHPISCWIFLISYSYTTLKSFIK